MKKDTNVTMRLNGEWIDGVTISDDAAVVGSDRRVIRVRWSDNSESIEDTKDLIVTSTTP